MYNQNDPNDMNRYMADVMKAGEVGSSNIKLGAYLNKLESRIRLLEKIITPLDKDDII